MVRKIMAAAIVAALPGMASASAIIESGNVILGVDEYGQLNVDGTVADVTGLTGVGVRWVAPDDVQYESTYHGCLCEGWGISTGGVGASANNDDFPSGASGMSLVSFNSTATTAESVVTIDGTPLKVTHSFQPTATSDLFEVIVTIENTGATALSDIVYRRAFDWDTSPTPFNEYVTIAGTATTSLLLSSTNNGFNNTDPTTPLFETGSSCGIKVDFEACGPQDHGAAFDFALEELAGGDSFSFSIFYGGAANKAAALAALGTVGAELYSFGWSGNDANQDGIGDPGTGVAGDITPTFIFAFKGVGGDVIVPPPDGVIPLPAGVWLMLGGLGALGALRRKQKAA